MCLRIAFQSDRQRGYGIETVDSAKKWVRHPTHRLHLEHRQAGAEEARVATRVKFARLTEYDPAHRILSAVPNVRVRDTRAAGDRRRKLPDRHLQGFHLRALHGRPWCPRHRVQVRRDLEALTATNAAVVVVRYHEVSSIKAIVIMTAMLARGLWFRVREFKVARVGMWCMADPPSAVFFLVKCVGSVVR